MKKTKVSTLRGSEMSFLNFIYTGVQAKYKLSEYVFEAHGFFDLLEAYSRKGTSVIFCGRFVYPLVS